MELSARRLRRPVQVRLTSRRGDRRTRAAAAGAIDGAEDAAAHRRHALEVWHDDAFAPRLGTGGGHMSAPLASGSGTAAEAGNTEASAVEAPTVEALDWQGRPLRCQDCPHEDIRAEGRCDLGKVCVADRRSKRIARFFSNNATLAARYLDHPYFEVRALAARHASIFLLPALKDDPEPDVRMVVALRLPLIRVKDMHLDPDPRVRIALLARLEGSDVVPFFSDADYNVRIAAARRAPPDALIMLMRDREPEVRRAVARRMPQAHLARMARDEDPLVRLEVAEHLAPGALQILAADPDMRVRFTVAERIDPRFLAPLTRDSVPPIAEVARQRLAGD
ncbi:4Fe4S-binding leucine-rich repeat protein [Xanthobacter dioxanivorans]|nr:4Fe4S-binding leucine-rich repeat protein [Xanthobacter dioxanivorans]